MSKGNAFRGRDLRAIATEDTLGMSLLGNLLDGLLRLRAKGPGVLLKLTEQSISSSVEGYRSDIRKNGVMILSRGQAGLFYGCQTLEQLL